jgi:hypothetical protein
MLTATPPAYYQQFEIDEVKQRPRGTSSDSSQLDELSKRAFLHLIATPRHFLEPTGGADEYRPPQAVTVVTKRVRFRYVGPGKPLPLAEETRNP